VPGAARGVNELSPEEQEDHLEQRLRTAGEDRFKRVHTMAGTTAEILPGDELPDGWLPERGTAQEASASTS